MARRPHRPHRALAITGESLLLLLALIVLSVAVTVQAMTDDQGRLQIDGADYATDAYAVVGDSWDGSDYTDLGFADAVYIEVTSEKDQFVGFANPEDAAAFLDGVEHTAIHRATGTEGPTEEHIDGGAPQTPGAEADIWAFTLEGDGTRTYEWDAESSGELTPIAMNADGSANVEGRLDIAYDVPGLGGIVAGLYIVGVLLAVLAVWLMVRTIRKPHKAAQSAA
ncbi:hypothetical protein [Glycomyces arizonensis]|uniref:hypothetical protein n=1 Tax=Glycomyces arizonensis TaxID=256035 RepID=UPI0003FE2D31|nr:hypothetical protein [Glycomyces arizonensis]